MYRLFLSLRYFRSRFLALASLLSITFGVAMLLIVLAVMGGYMEQIRESIRGQESHLRIIGRGAFSIFGYDELEAGLLAREEIVAAAPFIERLAVYKAGISWKPCQLHGIDPIRQTKVSELGRYVLRPDELDGLLARHIPPVPDDLDTIAPEPDVDAALREIQEILGRREPLTPAEVESFYEYEFRERVLRERNPLAATELTVAPSAVLVGAQLLLDQEVFLGDVLTVLTLDPSTGRPISENFVVVGAYRTGDFSFDSSSLLADLRKIRSLLGLFSAAGEGDFRYQGVRVRVREPDRLEEAKLAVENVLAAISPHLVVRTWQDLRQNMLRAVAIEKLIVTLIVVFLVFFTAMMILLMLILTVIEKTRDIGVLMALGAQPWGTTSIFLFNGLLISVLGTLAGIGLGALFLNHINEIHDAIYTMTGKRLFPAEIYQMDRIPVAYQAGDVILSAVVPVSFGLLASLFVAILTPLRDPIKAIQHE